MNSGYQKNRREKTRRHARERAYDRHGIDLTYDEERGICEDIKNGAGIFVGDGREGIKAYDVLYHGRLIRVLYSPIYHKLITVLPSNALARKGCD